MTSRLARVAAATLLFVGALAAPSAAQIFTSPVAYPTGLSPRFIAHGDFNADGAQDLLVLNSGSASVTVLMNSGTGIFGFPTTYSVGGTPSKAAVGDLNNDGRADFVVSRQGSSDLLVFLANAFGGFSGPTTAISGPTGPVALGRLNADANADLVTGELSPTVAGRVLLGNGAGAFGAPGLLPGTGGVLDLAIADLDNDTDQDIVCVNLSGTQYRLTTLLNNGTGGLSANPILLSTPADVLTLGDFNGVGGPDVALGFSGATSVRIFTNDGTAAFFSAGTFPTGGLVSDLASGELNGDGRQDLVAAHSAGTTLSVLVGDGTGSFGLTPLPIGGVESRAVIAADLNGDGLADLATLRGLQNELVVLFNTGSADTNFRKPMITEVSWGVVDFVEITNYDAVPVDLTGWTIQWKDGVTAVSAPLNLVLQPRQIAVVVEATGGLVTSPGVPLLVLLPTINSSTSDLAIALRNANGAVVDEVHIADALGGYTEGSLGGTFRGAFQRQSPSAAASAERIDGLDSNSAADWTETDVHSAGLENRNAGPRGQDTIPVRPVLISEIDDQPDLIEICNLSGQNVDLAGWFFAVSPQQNAPFVVVKPFLQSLVLPPLGCVVIGNDPNAPPELFVGSPYISLSTLGGALLPLTTEEYALGLYDNLGRVVDLVRVSGHDDLVVHNHPRIPAAFDDFTGAALRSSGFGDNALGRIGMADTNTGIDWAPIYVRTMGSANAGFSSCCGLPGGLDFRINATASGGGLTLIVNAGPSRAGAKYSVFPSFIRSFGQGPFFGLGVDALYNWTLFANTQPFGAYLDSRGSYRFDLPAGIYPPGGQVDLMAILQHPTTGALITRTSVVEFDT